MPWNVAATSRSPQGHGILWLCVLFITKWEINRLRCWLGDQSKRKEIWRNFDSSLNVGPWIASSSRPHVVRIKLFEMIKIKRWIWFGFRWPLPLHTVPVINNVLMNYPKWIAAWANAIKAIIAPNMCHVTGFRSFILIIHAMAWKSLFIQGKLHPVEHVNPATTIWMKKVALIYHIFRFFFIPKARNCESQSRNWSSLNGETLAAFPFSFGRLISLFLFFFSVRPFRLDTKSNLRAVWAYERCKFKWCNLC